MSQGPQPFPLARLKNVADVRPSGVDKHTVEGESPVRLCNYVDVYKNDRITSAIAFMEASATQAEIERFTLVPGDVLITKDSETPDDIAAAALVEESAAGAVCGYHLALLRPRQDSISGGFLFWCLKCPETLSQFSLRANGITRFGLTTAAMGEVQIPVPPQRHQSAIAAFLDRETGKIDALVAEQERLMALLKEKRQAVISQAVTKGLNPDAKMKPSGVEWLGEVPEHWRVARLGYFATVENGSTPSREIPRYWEDGTISWVSSGEVNQYRVTEPSSLITKSALQECSLRVLPPGTVLVGMIGQGRTRGMSAVLDIPATLNQNVAGVCCGPRLLSGYLHYVFQVAYDVLREDGRGGNQAALNCEILRSQRIPVPPPQEQKDICDYLDEVHQGLEALTAEAARAITLLKERRAALISAAVTGKIDVRDAVLIEVAA